MANSGSMLEQMLEAAVRNGGLRGGGAGGGAVPSGGGLGGLGDLLGGILGGAGQPGRDVQPQSSSGGSSGGSLGDILNSVLAGGAPGGASPQRQAGSSGGAISDILNDFARRTNGGGNGGVRQDTGASRQSSRQAAPSRQQQQEQSPMPQASAASGRDGLLKYGGLAVLGALAYQAYSKWQAEQAKTGSQSAALSDPGDSGFNPQHADGGPEALSDLLLNAMIASTQADGVIDGEEQKHIFGKLESVGMSGQDRDTLTRRLRTPVDPRELVQAASSPEAAAQIYVASALAVSVDTQEERRYLDSLAAALGLDPSLKAQLEQAAGRLH